MHACVLSDMQNAQEPNKETGTSALLAQMRDMTSSLDVFYERLSESMHDGTPEIETNVHLVLFMMRGRARCILHMVSNRQKNEEQFHGAGRSNPEADSFLDLDSEQGENEWALSDFADSEGEPRGDELQLSDVDAVHEKPKRALHAVDDENPAKRVRLQLPKLAEDVIARIPNHASVSDINNCRSVCRLWRGAIESHALDLWNALCSSLTYFRAKEPMPYWVELRVDFARVSKRFGRKIRKWKRRSS